MGGFGSGKGFRYRDKMNSGRQRRYVTQLKKLDWDDIDPTEIDVQNPQTTHHCFGGRANLKMRPHFMRGGGLWYDFECSHCKKGARRLYFDEIKLACRNCHNLAYPCENRGKTDRAIIQKWKYVHKLSSNGCLELNIKPKWKKGRPFKKLVEKAEKYERLAWCRFFRYGVHCDPYPLVHNLMEKFCY